MAFLVYEYRKLEIKVKMGETSSSDSSVGIDDSFAQLMKEKLPPTVINCLVAAGMYLY